MDPMENLHTDESSTETPVVGMEVTLEVVEMSISIIMYVKIVYNRTYCHIVLTLNCRIILELGTQIPQTQWAIKIMSYFSVMFHTPKGTWWMYKLIGHIDEGSNEIMGDALNSTLGKAVPGIVWNEAALWCPPKVWWLQASGQDLESIPVKRFCPCLGQQAWVGE